MYTFAIAESQTSLAGALPSTVLHGLLIAAAVAAGRTAPTVDHDPGPPIIDSWIVTQPRTPAPTTAFDLPAAPDGVVLCMCVPVVELPPGTTTTIDPRIFSTIPRGISGVDSTGPALPATVLTESEVDELPVLLAAGALRYPAVLAAARMSGSVTLEFVIDIEGRVTPEGMKLLSTTHQGFVAAAEEAVQTSRFHPAMKNGQKVPVRVRQTVTFRP